MKQSGVCPKCNSHKIGYLENAIQRTEALVDSRTVVGHCPAPLGIERTQSGGLIKVIKEGPVGKLEAYICTSCGFYETYIKDPAGVQYESLIGFKWINPSPK
jgi:predicted nucleic-acid-binding Zn-ribbon protein